MALPFQSPYGTGTLTISNPLALNKPAYSAPGVKSAYAPLTINNPLRLQNTGIPRTNQAIGAAPTPKASTNGGGGGGGSGYGSGSGGSGGGSTYDPYAAYIQAQQAAEAARVAQAEGDWGKLRDSLFGSINDRVGNDSNQYNSSLLDYLDQLKTNQRSIDHAAVQNELSKMQGAHSILDMVGHGIQSGGVILANKNASNSSAADAIARAYGEMGKGEMAKVNGQYAQGADLIHQQQEDLDQANATELRHAGEQKNTIINSILQDALQQLGQLNQNAAYASIPDRIDLEAKKAEIRQQALDALSKYDSVLSSGFAANAPHSVDQNRSEAAQLFSAGTVPDNLFQYSTNIPTQYQGTGPFASTLPIFTGA